MKRISVRFNLRREWLTKEMPTRLLVGFARIIDTINERIAKGVSWFILFLSFALVYEIVARYAFNKPTLWAHELSMFLYGVSLMLAGAYVLRLKQHVNLDLIYARVSRRKQAMLDLITAPVFFFIMTLMVWYGMDFTINSWRVLEVSYSPWHPPLYIIKTVVPLAAFLVLLQGIVRFIRDLFLVIKRRELK